MAAYDITLHGCDDSQTVTAHMTAEQLEAVQLIAVLSAPAHEESSCAPKLTVTRHTEVITND